MYYFGLKLHTLAFRKKGTAPFTDMIILSSVEENDLTALKTATADNLTHRNIFADKNILRFLFLEKQAARTVSNYAHSCKSNKGRRYHYYLKRERRQKPIF